MRELLRRKPGSQAALFAEARALVDDGLDSALVLELYPDERPWLEPLLNVSESVALAASSAQPSYYFEASLKRKVLAAGQRNAGGVRRGPVIALHEPQHRFRTALAGTALVGAAAAIGVATIVSLQSGDGSPSGGGNGNVNSSASVSRLESHLSEAQHHIDQFTQRASSGQVDEADVTILESDANNLAALAQDTPLDDSQKERAQEIVDKAVTALTAAQEKPALKPRADAAIETISEAAVAAGLAGVTPLTPEPTADVTPTVSATASPTASETATSSVTGTPSPSATAESTPTPATTPTETATVAPETPPATATATTTVAQSSPTGTVTPPPSATPTP